MTAYTEDDLLPLSALQHLFFCERQCALIHIEQIWSENLYTAEGRIMHERVDSGGTASRGDIRVECATPLRSFRLGLIGKADLVEFHRSKEGWIPFPVEYKRGKPKPGHCDKVQLCAQALSIEEMLNVEVPRGALFYGKTRRRQEVEFDNALRAETENAAERLHELIASGNSPAAKYAKKCEKCSLLELCLPEKKGSPRSVKNYIAEAIAGI